MPGGTHPWNEREGLRVSRNHETADRRALQHLIPHQPHLWPLCNGTGQEGERALRCALLRQGEGGRNGDLTNRRLLGGVGSRRHCWPKALAQPQHIRVKSARPGLGWRVPAQRANLLIVTDILEKREKQVFCPLQAKEGVDEGGAYNSFSLDFWRVRPAASTHMAGRGRHDP